jgi:UDP-N-acetylmuramate dehydrogenase
MFEVESQLRRVARGEVRSGELLSRHTSFKIGGPADFWVEPVDVKDLIRLIGFLQQKGVDWTVFGNGTNVLIRDGGFRGAVVSLRNLTGLTVEGNCIIVGAGEGMEKVLGKAVDLELSGLEFAAGIPGTVGGAVVTNAGGGEGEIGGVVRRVRVLDSRLNMRWMSGGELGFTYRSCCLSSGTVVVEVEMELKSGETGDIIRRRIADVRSHRRDTQPLDYPSAGCIFRNPGGKFAGELIESAGLAGKRIGDAEVSAKHANFIVNVGRAKALDVLALMELVKLEVSRHCGIELEREIRVIGS